MGLGEYDKLIVGNGQTQKKCEEWGGIIYEHFALKTLSTIGRFIDFLNF